VSLAAAQARAESRMDRPCRVVEWSEVTADPVTGADVLVSGPTVYAGRCEVAEADSQPREAEAGTGTVTTQSLQARLPVGTGPYKIGHVVELLDRDARSASAEVVRRLRVAGLHDISHQTSQRLRVEET
jgi:hypothetical protein